MVSTVLELVVETTSNAEAVLELVDTGRHTSNTVLELVDGKENIPTTLLVSEEHRPTRRYDEWGDIPVIDLSSMDRNDVRKGMGDAARDWGAFQVINHKVSVSTLQEVDHQVRSFFHTHVQRKKKLDLDVNNYTKVYYTGDNSRQDMHSLHWAESLTCIWKDWGQVEEKVQSVTSLIWPEGNDTFRFGTEEILKGFQVLAEEILHLLAEYLGLDTDFFKKSCFPNGNSFCRWNYYPSCAFPNDTLGAHAHTDPNLLTILYQDKLGGLQMKKGGMWYGVEPIDGALIINIGDCLHIYSNAVFHSVVHQVQVNEKAHRLSLASIYCLDPPTVMSAPDALVDDENPRKFKKMTAGEYEKLICDERSGQRKPERFNGIQALRDQISVSN